MILILMMTVAHYIGKRGDNSNYLDGYLTEFHMVDGQQKHQHLLESLMIMEFGFQKNTQEHTALMVSFYSLNKQEQVQNSSGIGADTSGNDNHFDTC
jgi:hypothetical protein